MQTICWHHRVKTWVSGSIFIVAVCIISTSLISTSDVQAAAPTVRTVTFVKASSALNANAKKLLLQWKPSLERASKLTVTGYAPNAGRTIAQNKLASSRATAVSNQLKRLGITATIIKKISLTTLTANKKVNTDKATIIITALKPSASPSASASPSSSASPSASGSPSVSASPSASASPSTEPAYRFSGSLILDFVDCNQFQKQLVGSSVTATPIQQGLSPYVFELDQSNTGHANNNLMNCAINWSDLNLPTGQYNVSIQIQCLEIPDAEVSSSAVCTPTKYLRQDLQTQSTAALTGSGPLGQLGSYSMSLNLPNQIEITQDKSVIYEAWLN